jgi:hypothetical protein
MHDGHLAFLYSEFAVAMQQGTMYGYNNNTSKISCSGKWTQVSKIKIENKASCYVEIPFCSI